MPLFGLTHLALLGAVILFAAILVNWVRKRPEQSRAVRLGIGLSLAANELLWLLFRYSHEGIHRDNLPLQLCDIGVWATVVACLTLKPAVVELDYFAGIAGAGMALLTPDLWSPWPSYPAAYFFIAHGGIVIGAVTLTFGRVFVLREGAMWRAYAGLAGYAAALGGFNAIFHTNYMYLCTRPKSASLLDQFGPWPIYLGEAALLALGLYAILWMLRPKTVAN